ncbi:MAG: DUF308 domain-containing protein [Pseudomonadota bacterium]
MILLGALALLFPSATAFAANILVGIAFLLTGALLAYSGVSYHNGANQWTAILIGGFSVLVGMLFIFNPAAGALAFTPLIVVIMLLYGFFEVVLGIRIRPLSGWRWLIGSGLASLLVGFFIAASMLGSSRVALGLFIGVAFITTGGAWLIVAQSFRADELQYA